MPVPGLSCASHCTWVAQVADQVHWVEVIHVVGEGRCLNQTDGQLWLQEVHMQLFGPSRW